MADEPNDTSARDRRDYEREQESRPAKLAPALGSEASLVKARIWINGLEYHAGATL